MMIHRTFALSVAAAAAMLLSAAGAEAHCGACGVGDAKSDQPHHAELGKQAPEFTLTDLEGNSVDLAALTKEGKIVVLEWFNPDCPFIKKHYEKSSTMNELAAKYKDKDVVWLAINSSHYADAAFNKKWAEKWSISHTILVDQDGTVGRLYEAKTTPHMYIIDTEGKLVYKGAIDNSPNPKAPDTSSPDYVNYVDQALTELLAGKSVTTAETKPYGCSVKYGEKTAKACEKCEDGKACDKCAA